MGEGADTSHDGEETGEEHDEGSVRDVGILVPPRPKPRWSVARPTRSWYVAALASELGIKPIARTVLGIPLALFRGGDGKVGALLDRCPHRNVPLSIGRVEAGLLTCKYHGWRFDCGGECRFIPSRDGAPEGKARHVPAYPTVEQGGCIWVYPTTDAAPKSGPFELPSFGPGYTTVRRIVEAESTLHAAIENALDVPHTAFVHRGLFRSKSRGIAITAVVRRSADRVEAEYIGEPRPPGIVGRMLSPSGGVVTHFDRFILPSIAQVEYRIGDENHFLVTACATPVTDFHTKIFAVAAFRTRFPGRVLQVALEPIAQWIFAQDKKILKLQTESIRRFGGEQYASTEIDVLGRHIWRMLRAAERGERGEVETGTREERITLHL